ncbi:hypothetical protein M413DRAFT_265170 [Hebeloma cylindrosporum]|uniref:Uncharacterized protein n=1 Tax=Hebeloma cylindrosporum TaxID=76867 RepID=A0A0C2YAM7_HEBCY|nr:hypothetical protein M413DRAFT_265170 [Hebeloma cylindrosporum h7]
MMLKPDLGFSAPQRNTRCLKASIAANPDVGVYSVSRDMFNNSHVGQLPHLRFCVSRPQPLPTWKNILSKSDCSSKVSSFSSPSAGPFSSMSPSTCQEKSNKPQRRFDPDIDLGQGGFDLSTNGWWSGSEGKRQLKAELAGRLWGFTPKVRNRPLTWIQFTERVGGKINVQFMMLASFQILFHRRDSVVRKSSTLIHPMITDVNHCHLPPLFRPGLQHTDRTTTPLNARRYIGDALEG